MNKLNPVAFSLIVGLLSFKSFSDDYITIIGNSMVDRGIIVDTLSKKLGIRVERIVLGGKYSYAKFCKLYDVLQRPVRPKYVAIEFRHSEMTEPKRAVGFSAPGVPNKDSLNTLYPALFDTCVRVFSKKFGTTAFQSFCGHWTYDTINTGSWGFDTAVEKTFLPEMIKICKEKNVPLIFLGYRSFVYAFYALWERDEVKNYYSRFANYCKTKKVYYCDYTPDPTMTYDAYMRCPSATTGLNQLDDHAGALGSTIWTNQLGQDISSIIDSKPNEAVHERTSKINLQKPTITSPSNGSTIKASSTIQLSGIGGQFYKWSYTIGNTKEIFIGDGNQLSFPIPASIPDKSSLTFMLYSNGGKSYSKCMVSSTGITNFAPVIQIGQDTTILLGSTLNLNAKVTDDGQPIGNKVTYSWSVVSGTGILSNTTILNPVASFTQAGETSFRLTAMDGVLTNSVDIHVLVIKEGDILILSPTSSSQIIKNDTLWVKWKSNIESINIELSINNGLSYENINTSTLNPTEPGWENYPVPLFGVPSGSKIIIRVSEYNGFTRVKSTPFIYQKTAIKSKLIPIKSSFRVTNDFYTISGQKLNNEKRLRDYKGISVSHDCKRMLYLKIIN